MRPRADATEHVISSESALLAVRGLDALGRFSAILFKGDNFYDFPFVFLNTKSLLKRDLL